MTNSDTTTATGDLLTAPEIARHIGASPKTLRRFIRSQDAACGKGNRYSFSPDEARALIAAFADRPTKGATTTRSADEVAALLD